MEGFAGGDEQHQMVGLAIGEATGRAGKPKKRSKKDVSDRQVVVLGSGNLGLVYLMEEPRRLTLEEIDERHPRLIPALRSHPHVGWILVRSAERGAVALGANGAHYLDEGRVEGEDPLAAFSPTAPGHLLRTDGFPHVADIMVGSFYDPELDEGCAFEELISFHGGIGGPQTQPFILAPVVAAAAGGAHRGGGTRPRGALELAAAPARRRPQHACRRGGDVDAGSVGVSGTEQEPRRSLVRSWFASTGAPRPGAWCGTWSPASSSGRRSAASCPTSEPRSSQR